MKQLSALAKLGLVLLGLVVGSGLLQAQKVEYLNSNNVNAGIGIGGNLFTRSDTVGYTTNWIDTGAIWDLFEVPNGSGKDEIYTAALWMHGVDQTGGVHCVVQNYFEYGANYFDGPIATTYGSNYHNYYRRVFKVTQNEISLFRTLIFPTTAPQVDSSILYWPGKGNPSVLSDYGVSIDSPLAPFVDINNNGIYEPLLGEYPAVVGDQNIFFVFNDIHGDYSTTGGTPFGMEIRGMASCFNDTTGNIPYAKNAINNTVFVQYQFENKSVNTYSDFTVGYFVDPDIGCFNNDYVGCDTVRNLMLAYNGTTYDPDCAPELGYGSLPIALGIQFLNQSLNVFGYMASGPAVVKTDPTASNPCSTLVNFLQARWADSTFFEYGKSGYNSGGAPTKFCFPGDPTDTTQWSEPESHTTPGDRRMVGALAPGTLAPGQILSFDMGFTTSYDSTSNNLSIVDTLKNDADSVRRFYMHHILPAQQTVGIKEIPTGNQFTASIYPNPTNNIVTIEAGAYIETIEITDITGRLLLTKTVGANKTTLQVTALSKGVYLLGITGGGNTVVKKLVIQ